MKTGKKKLKLIFCIFAGFGLITLVLPLVLYDYALGHVTTMPEKPSVLINKKEALELWASEQGCSPEKCASTTPYWMYRWLFFALVNDFIRPVPEDRAFKNISKMAGAIAITHLRKDNFKGKGMALWHLSGMCLGIWIQRNWTPWEIATRYKEINLVSKADKISQPAYLGKIPACHDKA